VGQYQHGSAKWLTEKEKDKAFENFVLDPNDPQIKELLRSGYDGLDFMKNTS
jgi:type IV secretion system protein VirD4